MIEEIDIYSSCEGRNWTLYWTIKMYGIRLELEAVLVCVYYYGILLLY